MNLTRTMSPAPLPIEAPAPLPIEAIEYTIEEPEVPEKERVKVTDWTGRKVTMSYSCLASRKRDQPRYEALFSTVVKGTPKQLQLVMPHPSVADQFRNPLKSLRIFSRCSEFHMSFVEGTGNKIIEIKKIKSEHDFTTIYVDISKSIKGVAYPAYDYLPQELTTEEVNEVVTKIGSKLSQRGFQPTEASMYNAHGIVVIGERNGDEGRKEYLLCWYIKCYNELNIYEREKFRIFEIASNWVLQFINKKLCVEYINYRTGPECFINGDPAQRILWPNE